MHSPDRRILLLASLFLLIGSLTAASGQTVSGSVGDGSVKRGKKAKATVVLEIPEELHTNSNKPRSEYLIPTTVRAAAAGLKLGPVKYPAGKDKKFGFSEDALNIYDGRVEFTFDVTVPAKYRKPTVEIDVTVRYQACNDEVCFPPRSKTIKLTANVT